ncbi:MAG: peroxiredoxin [Acidobacteriota bacterium]|nr:peroxiredoxin [Acidobacteriota bacterium]
MAGVFSVMHRSMLNGLCIVTVVAPLMMFAASVPSVGSMAPEFKLNSQEGRSVSLGDYRGSWVVLYFYPKDFSGGCTIEAHNFQRDQKQYQEKNAVVLGVSVDSADSHKQFCTKEGLNFKLLSDTSHKVSSQYGSLTNLGLVKFASRHTFIIDPQGKIARAYTDVNPNKHSEEVLTALAELKKQRGEAPQSSSRIEISNHENQIFAACVF